MELRPETREQEVVKMVKADSIKDCTVLHEFKVSVSLIDALRRLSFPDLSQNKQDLSTVVH